MVEDGRGLECVLDYHASDVIDSDAWPCEQISPYNEENIAQFELVYAGGKGWLQGGNREVVKVDVRTPDFWAGNINTWNCLLENVLTRYKVNSTDYSAVG